MQTFPPRDSAPDPRLDHALRWFVVFGALLVVVVPAARGSNAWLGALPLWLLGMPLASWWALHRFRLPQLPAAMSARVRTRHRQRPMARRRALAKATLRDARAA